MKKIVNGKLYDTATAMLLGSDSYGYSSDADYSLEELYHKRNGEYFLYKEGGTLSKACAFGLNEWPTKERIIPLTKEEARQWGEEHMSVEEYEAAFGSVSEGDEMAVWSVNVRIDTLECANRLARELGVSPSEVVDTAVACLSRLREG